MRQCVDHGTHSSFDPENYSKLRRVDVVAIRAMLDTKRFSLTEIAELFGVSRPTISLIHNGETWANAS